MGCRNNDDDDFDNPEFVFLPEVTQLRLPAGVEWVNNLFASNNKIYFDAATYDDEIMQIFSSDIYEMDFDGTNIKTIPNYDPFSGIAIELSQFGEDVIGNIRIHTLFIDNEGNIWIAEQGDFYFFDLPDDWVGEEWEKWEYRKNIPGFVRVRKLDNTGTELLSIDIAHITAGHEWFNIQSMAIDNDGNIFIGFDSKIHVLNNEGRALFTLDTTWIDRFIVMQDGTIAHTEWRERGRAFVKIDVSGKRWGEAIDLPNNVHNVFSGNDEYTLIFSDSVGLYGMEASTGDIVLLLNWIDSDMTTEGLNSVTFLDDERILITSQHWGSGGQSHEIIMLTKTPFSEIPERLILTLATFNLDWNIRSAIVHFNRTSKTHRINVTDYGTFSTDDDWFAGLARLSTEIISGRIPDILDVSNLSYDRYVASGLLVDLYTFIDSDPNLNRSDFMESVLKATEINGGLYMIFPTFNIITISGNPSVVGDYPGWTMDEFLAVLAANPDADVPLGQSLTKEMFLQALIMMNMDKYVDWVNGVVNFDSNEFISLLEFANTLPDDFDWHSEYIETHKLISSGRQLMMLDSFYDFSVYQINRATLGGEIIFKGFPAENRNGNTLNSYSGFAITEKCVDKEGAWSFIKSFLNEDWLRDNTRHSIPIMQSVFDEKLKDAMTEDEWGHGTVGMNGLMIELKPLTQAEADQILALINSVTSTVSYDDFIWNIVSESASSFFAGQISAQDAVRVIQNRVSTYVAEQG
jgi:ABC-type glycerol-3-phosphate transport system substrate-binding protein